MLRLLLIVTALLAGGCSDDVSFSINTSEQTPRERGDEIEAALTDWLATDKAVQVDSAECPDIPPGTPGQYVCTLSAGDIAFTIDVAMTPSSADSSLMDADYETQGVVLPVSIAAEMEEQLSTVAETPVGVTCDSPPLRVATPGDQFACTATRLSTSDQIPMVVTIDDQGGWNAGEGTL